MTVNLEFTYCNSNEAGEQETAQSRSLKKILLPCDTIVIVFVVVSDFFPSIIVSQVVVTLLVPEVHLGKILIQRTS